MWHKTISHKLSFGMWQREHCSVSDTEAVCHTSICKRGVGLQFTSPTKPRRSAVLFRGKMGHKGLAIWKINRSVFWLIAICRAITSLISSIILNSCAERGDRNYSPWRRSSEGFRGGYERLTGIPQPQTSGNNGIHLYTCSPAYLIVHINKELQLLASAPT